MADTARLHVVTASTNLERAMPCLMSWDTYARRPLLIHLMKNGEGDNPYLGVVPAFAQGVQRALDAGAEFIACLHDDLELTEGADGWDQRVLECFDSRPRLGLLGFGGATGLGAHDIYRTPYAPQQLARRHFYSNMREAEAHGTRTLDTMKVACLDGFSQIGRRAFWLGERFAAGGHVPHRKNLFQQMADMGLVHHAYDAALGAYARRLHWETWMLPIPCHHYGGRTAVGDAGYAQWAKTQNPDGDQGFWRDAHAAIYNEFRDVLPFDVDQRA